MNNETKNKIISWVEQIFTEFENVIVGFPQEDNSGGYTAEIVCVGVEVIKGKENQNYNVIVKKNIDDEHIMDKMNYRQLYQKEVFLYSTYIPFLNDFAAKRCSAHFDNIPHCYGTVDKKNHCVVLMENLKPKSYRTHPLGGNSMSMNHVRLVTSAYANWHAFGFAVRDQDPEILKNFSSPDFILENEALMDALCMPIENELQYIREIYQKKKEEEMVSVLQRLERNYRDMLRDMLKNEDHCIPRHGDSWNNNFLFHFNEETGTPEHVVIIDWQGGLLGSPMADFHQFLFYCCSRKELDRLDEILELYYSILSKKLKELGSDPDKCFPWEACKNSFEQHAAVSIAGVPFCARMFFKGEVKEEFDLADSLKKGSLDSMIGNQLSDPKKYFERIDGVLRFAIERNLI